MIKNFKRLVLLTAAIGIFVTPTLANAATSPGLGTAGNYSVLAGSEITNTNATTLALNAGISPGIGGSPHYSGFNTVTFSGGGSVHDADSEAQIAQADRATAYTALASQTCDTTYVGTQDLVGLILVPGVYCANSFELTGTLTLNGAESDVWIFKSASDLIVTGSTANIVFTGGGQPCNVWWRVVSTATFDAGSEFVGNVLADTSITFANGAALNGRALAGTAEVTLDGNSITGPTCITTSSDTDDDEAAASAAEAARLAAAAAEAARLAATGDNNTMLLIVGVVITSVAVGLYAARFKLAK